MKEQGNLDFDILDELFGRRFFIVVTNSTVQDIDLCENRKYYENVFKLYQDWFKYRKAIIKRMRLNEDEDATLKETVFLTFDKHKSNKQLLEEENEESDIN